MLGAFVVGQRLALRREQDQDAERKLAGSLGGKDTVNHKATVSHGRKCGFGHIPIPSKGANICLGGNRGTEDDTKPFRAWISF